ncbi:MAG TPA: Lin1244/Lin1753 domain-containing protein [Ignavibacteriaceae bacterium]|nr:Lin1244/Lin1753 domain-containing protein [Ignavibacteriaceae bacterium]
MKKDTYYFQHYCNARRDPKILGLIADCGVEGYGRFWILLEMLREQGGKMELNKQNLRAIQFEMQLTTLDMAENFVNELIDEYQLVTKEEGLIFNNRLLESIGHLDNIKEKRRSAVNKRWNKDTNVLQMNNTCNTNVIQKEPFVIQTDTKEIKGDEIKGKKTKVKKNIDNILVTKYAPKTDFIDSILDIFLEEYLEQRGTPYIITARGKERKAVTTLLQIYKTKNDKNSEETLLDMRKYFRHCIGITDDKFLYENMSPSIAVSQINKIKGYKNGTGSYKTSPTELRDAFESAFNQAGVQ